MENRITKKADGYSVKQQKRKRLYKITSVLVMLAAFCTTYALILPAITMDNGEYQCGIEEHIHTEECTEMQLICDIEVGEEATDGEDEIELIEEIHGHSEECYQRVQGLLICEKEETEPFEEVTELTEIAVCGMDEREAHEHAEECYEVNEELICEAEDGEHEHTEECYEVIESLICPMDEAEAHIHSEECMEYEALVVEPAVEAHGHTDECYEWFDELVCDTVFEEIEPEAHEEAEAHVHTEECYEAVCTLEEHTHSEECFPIYEMEESIEEENLSIKVLLKNEDGIPHNTAIEVAPLAEDGEEYAIYSAAADEKAIGERAEMVAYSVRLLQNDEEVEFPEGTITVSVTARKEEGATLFETGDGEKPDTEASHFTSLQILGDEVIEGASATIEADSDEDAMLMFTLGSSTSFAITRSVEVYPLFNIQYYANMNRFAAEATGSEPHIPIINTATEKSPDNYLDELGHGGSLPENKGSSSVSPTTNDIYNLALESIGGSQYQIKMELTPTEIYEAHENVIYSNALTVKALDVLAENSHYEIDFIRTQSPEQLEKQTLAGVSGLDEAYWTKYPAATDDFYSEYFFTNDPDATEVDGKKPIVISDSMTVRYVYHPTDADDLIYTPTNFFDYDISDSNYKSGSVTYMNTLKKGINSHSDNDDNTSYLAFGNSNAGSGYGAVTWVDGNGVSTTPNQYNRTGYLGCTFGLVSDYSWEEKRLIYSDNIDAPCFFTHEATGVTGKTSYLYTDTSGSTMNFSRYGDTYTLESVTGNQNISASNLGVFTGRVFGTRTLYSNDFWPMDDVWNTDLHFGDSASYSAGTKKFDSGGTTGNLPGSDDGLEHNSYFGLQFAVDFKLDGTYDGPLEYMFYGDDDMWVFLTDRTDPDNITTNLIADIGGVHSSVGSYTNLWDWVPNTDERHLGKGEYTLTFFYTERGASGSSCFMQFTIPDVIGTPILDSESGELLVKKQIKNDEEYEGSFTFDYHLDSGISRYYPYTIYEEAEGVREEIQSGSLLYTGQFMLEANQYIVIGDLPVGTTYTVKEVAGEYTTEWTYPNTASYSNFAVSGTVETADRLELTCVNTLTYMLPETGGEGTYMYTFGGALLMGAALILLVYNEKRRRRT